MLRSNRLLICRVAAAAAIALALRGQIRAAQEPPTPAAEPRSPKQAPPATASPPAVDPPIFIFLNTPADLEAFWRTWNQPDFVLQKGADYTKLQTEAARGSGARNGDSLRASIDGLAAHGEVVGDFAHLSLDLNIAVLGKEPVWLPIRLDDLTVTNAREAGRDLPLRNTDGRWEIGVQGAGVHAVRIDLLAPVKPTADGRRIELPIPRVASTRIELDVPKEVVDAVAGGRDLVAIDPIEAGQRTRLSANLSPRTSLELSWRIAAPQGKEPAPLLEARGEIALEIDAASVRTRATFDVSSSRGNAPKLVFTIGRDESLQAVELDDEPLAVESRAGRLPSRSRSHSGREPRAGCCW
ncbi:MAG TPA: hypothetical protein VGY53_09845 [Isosphaeraceae bacterium]|nr:hypothetical protein [Isosphaeraceae bacterium]